MKTSQLAVFLVVLLVTFGIMFGIIPPLLNAKSTLVNALGMGLAVATLFAAILTGHATYTKFQNQKDEE